MADFSAQIKAILDTSEIPGQIKNIENSVIKLSNFNIDASKIVGQIQSALNGQNFSLNLGRVSLSNFSNRMAQAGTAAGRQFSNSLNSSINNIRLNNGGIGNVRTLLRGANFDADAIETATKGLDKMLVSVNKLSTRMSRNGNIRLTIDGVDELGRGVQVVRELDHETMQIANTSKRFTQSFGESFTSKVKKFETTLKSANDAITSGGLESSIAKVSAEYEKLGVTGHDRLSGIGADIERLNTLQRSMSGTQDSESIVTYYNEFNDVLSRVRNNLSIVSTESSGFLQQNARGARETERYYDKINKALSTAESALSAKSIDSEISKVSTKYNDLANSGHSKLGEIKNDLLELQNLRQSMNSDSATDQSIISDYTKFNNILKKTKNNLSIVANESKSLATNLQFTTLENKMTNWIGKNSKAVKEYGAEIDSLRTRLIALQNSGGATQSDLKVIEQRFNAIKQEAIATGNVGKSFSDQFKGAFKTVFKYFSASSIIYESVRAFKGMYENVYKIDTAMTELKKVTNETDASYANFLKDAGKSSKQLGTTIEGLVSSTADFARLGYSFTDAKELAKVANVYAVVGDEVGGIENATTSIISTLAAFKDEIDPSEAISIVDKYNEVGKFVPKNTVMYWVYPC